MHIPEKEIERLKKLRESYRLANCMCDPIEFVKRQKDLLYAIAEFLLERIEKINE